MAKKIVVAGAAACMLLLCSVTNAQDSAHNKQVTVPIRASIVPGLSTQGKNDIYTTSNFSLNLFGGRTGSIEGLEIASWFNIDEGHMKYVQAAGWFNITKGYVNGVQMAGWFNVARSEVRGIQAAGTVNYTGKNANGLQMAGIYNHCAGSFNGMQIAGVASYTRNAFKGLQAAGVANINKNEATGLQIAGVFNYTKHLKGVQIGLVNMADSSSGYSIGLITIVPKGYHKLQFFTDEVQNVNVAFKSGNAKLYNILMAGVNAGTDSKTFSYGYGIGHEIKISDRFRLNPELTSQQLYLGKWRYTNLLNKIRLQATVQMAKGFELFAGPSFAVYYSNQPQQIDGYKFLLPSAGYHSFELWNKNVTGWIGWHAGISLL